MSSAEPPENSFDTITPIEDQSKPRLRQDTPFPEMTTPPTDKESLQRKIKQIEDERKREREEHKREMAELQAQMRGLLKREAEKRDLPPHNPATSSLPAKSESPHPPIMYDSLPQPKYSFPVLSEHADAAAIHQHISKLRSIFTLMAAGYRYEPTAFEARKLAHAAQSLTGIRHLQFLEGDGLQCRTFDDWAKAFKSAMLPLGWVSETEKKIYSLQPQLLRLDKIPLAIMDFKQWFALLKDSDSPMSEDVATHWLRNHMTPGLLAELERDFGGENQLRQASLAELLKHMEICATRLLRYQSAFAPIAPTRTPIAAVSPEASSPIDIAQWLNPRLPLPKGGAGRRARAHLASEQRCFLCRQPGHKSPDCPKRKEPTAIAAVSTFDHEEAEFEQEEGEMFAEVLATHLAPELSVPPILLECRIGTNGSPFLALFDTGATVTLVDPSLITTHQLQTYPSEQRRVVSLAGGARGPALQRRVGVEVCIQNQVFALHGYVMPLHARYKVILGLDFIRSHGLLSGASRLGNLAPDLLGPVVASVTTADGYEDLRLAILHEYHDIFPDNIGEVANYPPICDANSKVRHHINLTPGAIPFKSASYRSPHMWRQQLIEEIQKHREAGRLRPSSSPWAAPAFLVKKENGKFRFICDYRGLNKVTTPDSTPVPNVDDILHRAACGKIFAKIDLSDAFFQTLMHEPDIEKTAITTELGLFEWVVMPQGACNSPATQQRRLNEALRGLLGDSCEAYVDDIIVWAADAEDLDKRLRAVLAALRKSGLVCSPTKSEFFRHKVKFLGHVISANHIGPDPAKLRTIASWPLPQSVKELRSFLGLLQYLRKFIPSLATHTRTLTALLPPTPAAEKAWEKQQRALRKGQSPKDVLSWVWAWSSEATAAFEILKAKVAEISGLRPLDYAAALSGECPIYLFTDASNHGTGAWLGQGPDPDHAFPVAYDSRSLSAAERNYPTHEKELLAIVRALKLWRPLLLDVPIQVQTDHFTLKWFLQQRDLSERQKRWLGVLSRFDLRIDHISGVNNFIADALSRLGGVDDEQDGMETAEVSVAVLGLLGQDTSTITKVAQGYAQDQVMGAWLQEEDRAPGVTLENVENGQGVHQVLRWEGRLCVPDTSELREGFIRQCHDDVGHFGVAKTLEMVRRSYYWEGMRQDVVDYVSSCAPCQTSKSTTVKPAGRLHSLPVPQAKFLDIGIDFVGPLPTSQGFDQLIVITDRLTGYVVLIPTTITANAREVARLFYDHWLSKFGCPRSIVSDRGSIFQSGVWRHVTKHIDTKSMLSTSYHPQTDGISERSNKSVIESLRTLTDIRGRTWADHLQRIAFALNNHVRASTKHTPAELVFGKRLSHVPPLVADTPAKIAEALQFMVPSEDEWEAAARRMRLDEGEARDNLLMAKHRQAVQANKHRRPDPIYKVGDQVLVNTRNVRHEYKSSSSFKNSAKFIPRYDGPYTIVKAFPNQSLYELDVPARANDTARRHVSLLKPYVVSERYHSSSPPLQPQVPAPPRPQVLEVLDIRTRKNTEEVRVRLVGEPALGKWLPRVEVELWDGFKAAWEVYDGPDELLLE